MKSVGGAGLVIIGFLFLYLAITGRLDCFFTFVSCVTGVGNPGVTGGGGGGGNAGGGGGGGGIDWNGIITGFVNNAACRNGRNLITGQPCQVPLAGTPPISGRA